MSRLPSFPAGRLCVLVATLAAALLLPACTSNRELARRAQTGDASAQFEYGRRLLTGQHHLFDHSKHAAAWFRISALQGYAPAQTALGACYEGGLGGLTSSPTDARYWYTLAAEQGDSMALQHLILADYREEKNPRRSFELLKQAADSGFLPARLLYGMKLLEDGGDSLEDTRHAIDQLRIAAMDGCREAAYLMGLFYASGLGVPQHSGIAIGWFETAAQDGYEPAQQLLNDLNKAD